MGVQLKKPPKTTTECSFCFCSSGLGLRTFLIEQMRRLPERPVAGLIPRRKPHPLPAFRVERNLEAALAEWRLVGCRDDLAVGFQAVAPDYLNEFQRERPLQIRHDR